MTRSSVAIMAALAGMLGAATTAKGLRVVAPSEGMAVVAERPYPVQWVGVSADARFEIDLHYCDGGSYSFCWDDDDCGEWVEDLCLEADGCTQEDGHFDVALPNPIGGYSGDGYRIRIAQLGTDRVRCSGDFYLVNSADAPELGEDGAPVMMVVEPSGNAIAVAGDMYTVEFYYDNGFGESLGRFKIDLYEAEGGGDCGTWVTSVCDKPNMGCHDTQGNYDVVIPENTASGMYSIRVGLFGDDAVYACSRIFDIVPQGESLWGQDFRS